MSSFTRFDGRLHIVFAVKASEELGDEYWVLKKSFTYYLCPDDPSEFVRVPAGFLSDAASIPAFARVLIPKMGLHSQSAFLHDYLCDTYSYTKVVNGVEHQEPIDRKKVDHIFYEALRVSKYPKWRIDLIKLGVDLYRWVMRPKKPKPNAKRLLLEEYYREKWAADDECKH